MRAGMMGMMLAALGLSGSAFAQHTSGQDEQILQQGSSSGSGGTEPAPPMVDEEEISSTYSTIGLQKVHANFANVKDAINLEAVIIGFRVPAASWFGVELGLSQTFVPGQIDPNAGTPADPGTCNPVPFPGCRPATAGTQATASGDFSLTSIGARLVLNSPGTFFVSGKYGYRYLNTSLDQLANDRSGTDYHLGVGYRWNKKGSFAEIGYTKLADKVSGIGFSISYSYDRR